MIGIRGKCTARREGEYWIAACYPDGERMKIVKDKDIGGIKDFCEKNNLKLEIINKLKIGKSRHIFSRD